MSGTAEVAQASQDEVPAAQMIWSDVPVNMVAGALLVGARGGACRPKTTGAAFMAYGEDAVKLSAVTAAQVRGVLAERVVISTALDGLLSLRVPAAYAGLPSWRAMRSLAWAIRSSCTEPPRAKTERKTER